MPKLSYVLAILLFTLSRLASADLLSPGVMQARDRLQANPKVFDRFDTYCKGKRVDDACSIPGSSFAGGGKGLCTNEINAELSTIDLTCVRAGAVDIDRGLPADGFVNDERLCGRKAQAKTEEERQEHARWNCVPLQPTPADRFCSGKDVGSRCSVELVYLDATERDEGVCKQVIETTRFYYQGRRQAIREVIRCEPERPAQHVYKSASWWQKLAP